ncbi:MAG: quinone oxidoreductase [SAR202 cluster bacterium]|jgi:NADPH:quinone reductase|nr:quinone oxidoreductase [SAR202 cluster bacterium]
MKAIQISEVGGPEVLRLSEIDPPTITATQALIKVSIAGVNFIDIYHRLGRYPQSLPFTPGVEGIGTISELGADAPEDLQIGMRVGWVMASGGYAEFAAIPAASLIPIPEDIADEDAIALLLQGMTAHYLTRDSYRINPGDTALVHSGAGGVGLLLTQYIKSLGGRVIATASTAAKQDLARSAGADLAIGYEDFAIRVKEFTDGKGVNVIYDGVGQSTFEQGLQALGRRGTFAIFGAASGQVEPIEIMKISTGSIFLTRPTLADFVATREELLWRANDVFAAFLRNDLKIAIVASYALSQASDAHLNLENRTSTGKLILKIR